MLRPFAGMGPHREHPSLRPEVHQGLTTYAWAALNTALPEHCVANAGERPQSVQPRRESYPDIAVFEHPREGRLNRLAVLASVISLATGIAAFAAGNPVPNPGFEDAKEGKPIGWSTPGQPKGFAWSASAQDRHSGNSALNIQLTSNRDKDAHIEVFSDPFQVDGGKLHRLFGWYKSSGWSGKGNIYSQSALLFYDEGHKGVSGLDGSQLEIPYASSEAWKPVEMVVPVPPAAKEARIMVRVHVYDAAQEKTPALFVDDLLVQAYDVPEVSPEARKWVYPARMYGVNVPTERVPGTQVGGALHARVGRDPASGIISGPMIPDQGPGMYRVTYRMMVADNSKPDQVCTIYVASNGVLNSHTMRSRMILATDFKKPNQFEEFSLDFLRPPLGGMQYLCTWWGKVDLLLDTFTVTEVKRLADGELLSVYGEAPGGEAKPDSGGGFFVLRGPFFPLYRLDQVAAVLGTKVTRVAHMATPGGNSTLNPPFPTDPADLSGLRAVILADVDAEALGFYGRGALRKFVEAGGTLVLLGGWVSFGEGKMEGTFVEEMLPVANSGPFDHEQCDPPSLVLPGGGWPAVASLPWADKPAVVWIHRLTPKPGARVLVSAGGKPFMVSSSFGKGRVVACAGTVLGTVPPRVKPFWEWSRWPELLARAIEG